jgi:hypothetical protein
MSGRKRKKEQQPTVINLLILGHGDFPEMQTYHSRSNQTNTNLFPTTDLIIRSDDKLSIDLIMVDETRECSLINRSEMDKIIQIASDSFSETGLICNPDIVTILNTIQDEELKKGKILSSTYKFKLFRDIRGLINKKYTLDTGWGDIPPYKIFCSDQRIQSELTSTLTPGQNRGIVPTLLRDVLFEILSTCSTLNINNIKINIVDTSCNYLYSRGNVKIDSFIASGKQKKTKKIKRVKRKKTKKYKK